MLEFHSGTSAIFMGLEAEGPYKGMPTLFIVGSPDMRGTYPQLKMCLEEFKNFALGNYEISKWRSSFTSGGMQFGIYFGAGGSLTLPDHDNLSIILLTIEEFVKRNPKMLWRRTALEAKLCPLYTENLLPVLKLIHFPLSGVDWILPLYWQTKKESTSNSLEPERIDYYKKLGVHFWSKIYIQDKLLMIASFEQCYFADYDNNVGEFKTDKLLFTDVKNA